MNDNNELLIQILQTLNNFQLQTAASFTELRSKVEENKKEIEIRTLDYQEVPIYKFLEEPHYLYKENRAGKKMIGVGNRMKDAGKKMIGVGKRMKDAGKKTKSVGKKMKGAGEKIKCFGNKMQKIEKEIIVSYWIYYSNLILQFPKELEIRMQKKWKNT